MDRSLPSHASQPRVNDLTVDQHSAVSAFLNRDIAGNLFLIAWLENYGLFAPGRPDLFRWQGVQENGRVVGVSLSINERLCMLSTDQPSHAATLASAAINQPFTLEHIVGEASAVDAFWNRYKYKCGAARLHRDQEYMRLDRTTFNINALSNDDVDLRFATYEDLDAVFLASAAMHAEETLDDPLQRDATLFRRHIEQRIQSERTLVWFEGKRLLFKADISSRCKEGIQISGVYTPPALRGNGYGSRGVGRLCELLFSHGYPLLTLYVNRENTVARSLYQKLSFQPHLPYHTIFVA